MIRKKDVVRLAELARIRLEEGESGAFHNDLERILAYFEKLKAVDTEGVAPMSGGTAAVNVMQGDEGRPVLPSDADRLVQAFPEREGRYLKVPPVF